MLNFYFKDDINSFLQRPIEEIIGTMLMSNDYDVTGLQKRAWEYQINILKNSLTGYDGVLFFEFSIPRMGKRVDALVLIKNVVFVIMMFLN